MQVSYNLVEAAAAISAGWSLARASGIRAGFAVEMTSGLVILWQFRTLLSTKLSGVLLAGLLLNPFLGWDVPTMFEP